MPVYSICDDVKQEIFEVNMKYSELVEYLETNTHLRQVFTKFPGVVDSVRIGVKRTDDSFKDVLKNVKSHHYKSNIDAG